MTNPKCIKLKRTQLSQQRARSVKCFTVDASQEKPATIRMEVASGASLKDCKLSINHKKSDIQPFAHQDNLIFVAPVTSSNPHHVQVRCKHHSHPSITGVSAYDAMLAYGSDQSITLAVGQQMKWLFPVVQHADEFRPHKTKFSDKTSKSSSSSSSSSSDDDIVSAFTAELIEIPPQFVPVYIELPHLQRSRHVQLSALAIPVNGKPVDAYRLPDFGNGFGAELSVHDEHQLYLVNKGKTPLTFTLKSEKIVSPNPLQELNAALNLMDAFGDIFGSLMTPLGLSANDLMHRQRQVNEMEQQLQSNKHLKIATSAFDFEPTSNRILTPKPRLMNQVRVVHPGSHHDHEHYHQLHTNIFHALLGVGTFLVVMVILRQVFAICKVVKRRRRVMTPRPIHDVQDGACVTEQNDFDYQAL